MIKLICWKQYESHPIRVAFFMLSGNTSSDMESLSQRFLDAHGGARLPYLHRGRKEQNMAKKKIPTPQLTGKVIGGDLNIREQPSKTAGIVGVLKNETPVKIMTPGAEFHQIPEGYVMAQFIELDPVMDKPTDKDQ